MDAPAVSISPAEFVLRRVPKGHYDATLPVPVQKAAACPTPNDHKGLSVDLERYYSGDPRGILAQIDPAKRDSFRISRVLVADLQSIGLSVVPDEGPEHLPGHCAIPELRRAVYEANKLALADTILALTKLLSRGVIDSPSTTG